jgi:DNA-binding NarL/FixJ family response regulator
MSNTIRLLLVDDHDLVRAGIARLLNDFPDLDVVGEAGSALEALPLAQTLHPDVILMDIDMPEEDGISATRRIRGSIPDARIIMLTMHGSDEYVLNAIRAGAYGYLLKDASAEELVGAIRAVAADGAVITPRLARRMLDDFAHQPPVSEPAKDRAPDELSPREAEILALIASGETSRTIAARLFLSENTVKHHTSNIFQKLHVRHRSQAAAEAVRRGLVTPPTGPSQH